MLSPRLTFCFTALLFMAGPGRAQQEPYEVSRGPKEKAPVPAKRVNEPKTSQVFRVHGFVDRVQDFHDAEIRITTLARLADLLWKEDEPYARQLFLKTIDLTAAKGEPDSDESAKLNRLRLNVLALLAQRDPALAKRLIDVKLEGDEQSASKRPKLAPGDFDRNERRTKYFKLAYDLVATQPARSVRFAELSLQDGVFPHMNVLLLQLRPKNEAAANLLFLETLDRLVLDPNVDADTLLRLGTYVFTSPRINAADPNTPPDMTTLVGVGDLLVIDITADRPNVPRALVLSYLAAATRILMRPVALPEQRSRFYVAGYLLFPKAQRYAPDLTYQISAAMQTLIRDVPTQLTQDSTYENLTLTAPKTLDKTLSEIEKNQNEEHRDAQYLALVSDLWQNREFKAAETVAARIQNDEARTGLATIISFGKAVAALEEQHYEEAEGIAAKLPQGVELAVLKLGFAHAYLESGDSQRALESINSALTAARHVEDARSPFLMLSSASQLTRIDSAFAHTTLREAVKEFNVDRKGSAAQAEWQQRIAAGMLWRYFPVRVKGVDLDLEQTLSALVKTDREGTMAAVNELADEEKLGRALIAVARVILK